MMTSRLADRLGLLFFGCWLMIGSATAQMSGNTISGTVTNGTTGKPAAGDNVTLMSLERGMEEVGNTKTDAQGRYTFASTKAGIPHLVRVSHNNVNYHAMVPPTTKTADITVYDVAKKVPNIIGEGHVYRFQTVGNDLEVSEAYFVRNESAPPRTQMGDKGFEFTLPSGASIEDGQASGPGGMPTNVTPTFAGKKDTYAFDFPLRPGKSQFQVTYKVPYAGSRDFAVTPDMPYAELGVMVPKSMKFESSQSQFQQAQDEEGMATYVAKSLVAGTTMRFTVSGQGTMPTAEERSAANGGQSVQGNTATPADSSAPLNKGYWLLIAGFVLAIAAGVYWLVRTRGASRDRAPTKNSSAPARRAAAKKVQKQPAASASPASGSVLDALKEELLQLETERLEGRISQEDYVKSKAGLEILIKRQLANSHGK